MDVLVLSMYASQSQVSNARAFDPVPPNTRKCILATNIAETSITIPGVKYVIDTGKCKEKHYLARDSGGGEWIWARARNNLLETPNVGFDTLLTRDITKSSAMQRAGRAGREVRPTSIFICPSSLITGNSQTNRVKAYASASTLNKPSAPCLSHQNPKFCDVVSHLASYSSNA